MTAAAAVEDDIREGRAHRICLGCGSWHGPVEEHIRCLERALARERQHPDRLRGQAAREAYEAWEGMRKR